jgi:hypothetical protein
MNEPEALRRRRGLPLSPRFWIPATAVFAAATAALAVFVAFGISGDTTVVRKECKVGEPGCETRRAIHEHADFAIFVRGQQIDFGQYMSEEHDEDPAVVEIADMHFPRTTIVHVHLDGTTWDEFLRSMGFDLTDPTLFATPGSSCMKVPSGEKVCEANGETFKFYINGVKVDGVASQNIRDLDRMMISFGSDDAAGVQQQLARVTDQACIPSEVCRDREPAGGEPPEPCSKSSNSC